MKRAEIQLPEPLYQQIEGLARQLDLTVPDVLRQADEQMVQRQPKPQPKGGGGWRFPEGRHLGPFGTPVEDWRLLANEAPAD
ncbi:MAG: antitoxin [Gammaproteobacteria bacterium]|nr:antitoxin [Gammaproteobacteria bacterium]